MKKTFLLPLAVACLPLVLLAPACDEASPVAPAGTVLSITVSPSRIDASGTATVRVTALKANGTAVNPGTEVRLDTTLGTIPNLATTDANGVAEATLQGDGRVGTATVTARAGAAEAATVDVEIGEFAADVRLQATPSQVGPDESVSLLAIVRDDEGRPLAGANANFLTDLGTLDSRGALVTTDSNGQATDRLRVSQADIDAFGGVQFTVSVAVGSMGSSQTATATIRIRAIAPRIRFFPTSTTGNRVFFRNETEGEGTITYAWDFQSDGTVDSMLEEPTFDYGSPGSPTVTLQASNGQGDTATAVCTFAVPVTGNPVCESE